MDTRILLWYCLPSSSQELFEWIETIYWLPKDEARETAKNYYERYPKMGYETHIHHWHESKDGRIYFLMPRRPTCD